MTCVYEPLKTWLFVSETEKQHLGATVAPSPPTSLPLYYMQASEMRALAFFREQTTPSLSAFSKFTTNFWMQLIPQVSETESAVRHMAIALASRQELLYCSPERLQHLSMIRSDAVATSVNYLTQPDCNIVAVLLCGLFFTGYECLQNPMEIDSGTSVRHLGAGLRILEEHRRAIASNRESLTSSVEDVVRNFLEPMYLQMEMMLSMFTTPIHTVRDLSSSSADAKLPHLPPRFTDLQHASRIFFRIYRWHYHYRAEQNESWTPTSNVFQTVRKVFLDWYTLIMAYNDSLDSGSKDDNVRHNLMMMVSHWSLLMVGMVHSTASPTTAVQGQCFGSPYFPHGGRLKTSIVDLSHPTFVTVNFIIDAQSLQLLEICDLTEEGLSGDPSLRIWPAAEVRKLDDGSGRGIVSLRMGRK